MGVKRNLAARRVLAIGLLGSTISSLAPTQAGEVERPADVGAPTRLAPVLVIGTNILAEEVSLGENRQPEWAARRRFVTTRIYVQPPWQGESEGGLDCAIPRARKAKD